MFGVNHKSRAIDSAIRPPLRLAWIGRTGAVIHFFSSPILADNKIAIGVTDGQLNWPRAAVVCFDARTGKRLWRTKTDADIHSPVAALGGKVYAASTNGGLTCLDLATGRTEWTKRTHNPRFHWTMTLAPVSVSKNRVYAVPDLSATVCLDARSGKRLWTANLGGGFYRTSGLGVFDGVGHTSDENYHYAVDVVTGKPKWKKKIRRRRGMSTPVRYGNTLYVPHAGMLRAVRADSGEEIWAVSSGGGKCPGLPVEHKGRVFTSGSSSVYAFDAKSGKRLWVTGTPKGRLGADTTFQTVHNTSAPAVARDYVYVGSDNGTFYCLDAATGQTRWQYYVGVPIKSSPVVSGNMVYISAFDGNVYAFVGTRSGG